METAYVKGFYLTLAGCWYTAPSFWHEQQTLGSSVQLEHGSGILIILDIPLNRDSSSLSLVVLNLLLSPFGSLVHFQTMVIKMLILLRENYLNIYRTEIAFTAALKTFQQCRDVNATYPNKNSHVKNTAL